MLRISLFLVLGLAPLTAQQSLNHGDNLNPDNPPTVVPGQPPGNAVVAPGNGVPPPAIPPLDHGLPAAPPILPHLTVFTISPGTVRQGLTDKNVIRTKVTFSAPATKDMPCHVVTSNPHMMLCSDIIVHKGQTEQEGNVEIFWKDIHHDVAIEAKVTDPENPETLLRARVYLHIKLE